MAMVGIDRWKRQMGLKANFVNAHETLQCTHCVMVVITMFQLHRTDTEGLDRFQITKKSFMSAMRWSNVCMKHFTIKSCRIYEHFLLLLRTTFRNIEGLHVSALLIFIWNNKTYKCVDKMPRTELYNVKLPISLLPQVCDMFLKYGLPLVVMPPPGVFYPTLFATDPISVDRLAYIMYRWALFISFV